MKISDAHGFTSDESLVDRILLRYTNEAALCLQEEVIMSPQEGDIGAIFGTGYPPNKVSWQAKRLLINFKKIVIFYFNNSPTFVKKLQLIFQGGPFMYMDTVGAENIISRLEPLAEKIGEEFAPSQILYDMAKSGKKFY